MTDAFVASRARRLYLPPGTSPSSRTRRPIRGGATADDAADSADVHAERMRPDPDYDAQRKLRMSWMHWLHDKPKHARWAADWQREAQAELCRLETVRLGEGCFVADGARVFAEPGRDVIFGDDVHVGADVFIHGPVTLHDGVALNARCHVDGGSRGVVVGAHSRLGPGCQLFAFNHGFEPDALVKDQPVTSEGIVIGEDCWLGAAVCVTDGVTIGDHAVVGMGAVVTRDVPAWAVAGGNPARVLGDRRTWRAREREERTGAETEGKGRGDVDAKR